MTSSIKRGSLLSMAALASMASGLFNGLATPTRVRPAAPTPSKKVKGEIAKWNAAIDAKNAYKKARKMAQKQARKSRP